MGTVDDMGTLLLILALVVAAIVAIAVLKFVAGLVVAIVLVLGALYLWKRYAPSTTWPAGSMGSDTFRRSRRNVSDPIGPTGQVVLGA